MRTLSELQLIFLSYSLLWKVSYVTLSSELVYTCRFSRAFCWVWLLPIIKLLGRSPCSDISKFASVPCCWHERALDVKVKLPQVHGPGPRRWEDTALTRWKSFAVRARNVDPESLRALLIRLWYCARWTWQGRNPPRIILHICRVLHDR